MTERENCSLPRTMQRRIKTVLCVSIVFALILGAWIGPKAYLWFFSVKESSGIPSGQASDYTKENISNKEKKAVADAMTRFICETLAEEEGTNKICLPVNDYLLLSAIIEFAARDTQQSIISMFEMEDIDQIRNISAYLYNKVLKMGEKCVPATSLWLNNTYTIQQESMERLINNPFFDIYEGRMGCFFYNKAMQAWVGQTANRGIKRLSIDSEEKESLLGIISSIRLKITWTRFSRLESQNNLFFTKAGSENTTFMTTMFPSRWYYQAQHFNAVRVLIEKDMYMWFILPEESISPEEIVLHDEFSSFLHKQFFKTNSTEEPVEISLSFPRFSFAVENDKLSLFSKHGLEECFSAEDQGMSSIANEKDYIGFIRQYASISVNEEGINRISFPHLRRSHRDPLVGESIDFMLNRPFILLLVEGNNIPILATIVNNP